jgi:hypothetical protein
MPVPIVIEQAEPGGVIWTTRSPPLVVSKSMGNPQRSP